MSDDSSPTETAFLGPPPGPAGASLPRGTAIGRYVILDRLGGGGMGVVYTAYDPELDRKVALKLVRPDRAAGEAARLRLLREAQAIARLSHPNVVAVFDAGTFGDQVFLAMEHVEGTTLRRWLDEERWPWGEVVGRFVLAGRGLAAAHAAGLVHCDFKPDNVLLGQDGRVRVADFGLARAVGEIDLEELGVAMGTPGYMAPEQLRGERTDARSDQFSFCVALWEALYGERPFSNTTPQIPAGSRVPDRLRQALLRGLSADPAARYPGMEELLDHLAKNPEAARRRWLAAGAAVLTVGGIFAGLGYFQARRGQICSGGEEKLARVWNEESQEAVRAAFLETGLPVAGEAWSATERTLDRYARSWAEMHREACEATRLRGEQSEELLDRRMVCLDQKLEELGSLVHLFTQADAQILRNAPKAAGSLGGIADCAPKALAARVPLPGNPEVRARVSELRARLSDVSALQRAGKIREALALAETVEREARAVPYRPLQGQALYVLGELSENAGEFKKAETYLYQALWAAEEGRDDFLKVGAWRSLIHTVGYRQSRFEEAHRLARHARAALERAGGDPRSEAELLNTEASVYLLEGRYDEALRLGERALAIANRVDPLRPNYVILSRLDSVEQQSGHPEKALDWNGRALAAAEREVGPLHPETAAIRFNRGLALTELGRLDEAEPLLLRALADREKVLGPGHVDVGESLMALGHLWNQRNRPGRALPYFERALAIYEESSPGTFQAALARYNLGDALRSLRRFEEALMHLERSLQEFETIFGPDHGYTLVPLSGIGEARLDQGHPAAAIPPLERALALPDQGMLPPDWQADARFLLARALWNAEKDRPRALRLAHEARAIYAEEKPSRPELAKIDAWLGPRESQLPSRNQGKL
ncbi:MAG TPA: serine/threonine-protein kinase [Thermoanaerobaculia bacterium]|nr:serine/threonine-protein kinase [Thermoanaerobaculia bacterium]